MEHNTYLMKSGHSEKDIDKAFGMRETQEKMSNRKQNNKI